MNLNELITKKDLENFKQEVFEKMTELLNSTKKSDKDKNWVKSNEAKELLDCSQNTLDGMVVDCIIKRNKIKGRWYYSVKSINDSLENKTKAA